jgi:hypothetical protein
MKTSEIVFQIKRHFLLDHNVTQFVVLSDAPHHFAILAVLMVDVILAHVKNKTVI